MNTFKSKLLAALFVPALALAYRRRIGGRRHQQGHGSVRDQREHEHERQEHFDDRQYHRHELRGELDGPTVRLRDSTPTTTAS